MEGGSKSREECHVSPVTRNVEENSTIIPFTFCTTSGFILYHFEESSAVSPFPRDIVMLQANDLIFASSYIKQFKL